MVDLGGWDGAFKLMMVCAAAAAVLMAFTWNVGAHPQKPVEPQGFPVMPARAGEAVAAAETK